MATVQPSGIASGLQNYYIKEDSSLNKAIACIPIVGGIIGVYNESSLAQQISSTKNVGALIRFIEVKNHYKIASIVREVLLIAIIAYYMATGMPDAGYLAGSGACIVVLTGLIAWNGYSIYHNKEVAEELSTKGIRLKMLVR